jgi:flagellar biosynthesis/type III secretory pathway chaperone
MSALAELLACLEEEERAGRELCELARQKQRVLISGSAADLMHVVQAEQVMLAGLSRSEVRRAEASRALARSLGLPGSASLEALAGVVEGEEATALRERGRRISATLAEIRACNEQNAELIRQSLAFVRFSLGLLTRAAGESETYAPQGRQRTERLPRLLDREA